MSFKQGLASPYAYTGSIITEIYGVAINFFPNRNPLATRLPIKPIGSTQFKLSHNSYRPSNTLLTDANGITNANTTITLTSSAPFVGGDVLQIGSELLLVTAVNTTAATATVTRGHAGTTAAAANTNSTVYLVGNTRTGAEVDVDSTKDVPTTTTQNCQTVQHPFQIGGALAATTPQFALPSGAANVVDHYRMMAMQHVLDDIERSFYYGQAVALAADTTRPMMTGLKALLTTNSTTSPTNGSAYKPSDLERDTLQKAYAGGGQPDLLVMSTDWRTAFVTWGFALQRLDPGVTSMLGVPIERYSSPFLGDVTVILSPLLRSGSCVCMSSAEAAQRVKRGMFDKPRGSRGDAEEGDIIWEGAIEIFNEAHHAWLEGVTGFAVQS